MLGKVVVDGVVHHGLLPQNLQVCLQAVCIYLCILVFDMCQGVEEGAFIVFDVTPLVELLDVTLFHTIN
jgi:hypothetical protein